MKKIISVALAAFILCASVFALPGISEYIPTESGQYVYYRDYTFDNETYIGFLYYNESTIAVRSFSLDTEGKKLSDLTVYFSLDAKADHIELTGEKLPDGVSNNDVNSINYIHNMLYELAGKRKHQIEAGFTTKEICSTEDFPAFGGQVTITYDYKIPFFNIKSVESIQGEKLFSAVTMGNLLSNTDKTFISFNEMKAIPVYKEKKLSEKQLKKFVWKEIQPSVESLGNDALKFTMSLDFQNSAEENGYSAFEYFCRSGLLSANDTYISLETVKFNTKENQLVIEYDAYSPLEKEQFAHVIKIINTDENSTLTIISVYEKFYQENRQYFESLLK